MSGNGKIIIPGQEEAQNLRTAVRVYKLLGHPLGAKVGKGTLFNFIVELADKVEHNAACARNFEMNLFFECPGHAIFKNYDPAKIKVMQSVSAAWQKIKNEEAEKAAAQEKQEPPAVPQDSESYAQEVNPSSHQEA